MRNSKINLHLEACQKYLLVRKIDVSTMYIYETKPLRQKRSHLSLVRNCIFTSFLWTCSLYCFFLLVIFRANTLEINLLLGKATG